MKPRTIIQKQVVAASKHLPSINHKQKEWLHDPLFEHYVFRTKNGEYTCGECAGTWQGAEGTLADTICGVTCPHCGAVLKLHPDSRKRVIRQKEYGNIITMVKGLQVIRTIYAESTIHKGERAYYYQKEVFQRWISPEGKTATMALLRGMSGYYCDVWQWSSKMEIRKDKNDMYDRLSNCPVYPRMRIIPELKRNGFSGEFHHIYPYRLFVALLQDSKAETLLKSGQAVLLRHFVMNTNKPIGNYWQAIRICVRNHYNVSDASIWCDYIDLLNFFGKDLHNAKYVCPNDLKAEHDRLVKKRRQQQEEERRAENKRKALEKEATFKELKARFFGIAFTDGEIEVRMLDSVEDIMREGDEMHHCVFASEYHLRADSLILSARIDGKRIETVEFSLSKMKVVQSRGVCNSNTEYHERIIQLVTKNRRLIKSRMAA